jgi:acyl dehydratase
MSMRSDLYFEDVRIGAEFRSGRHQVTAAEISAFARLTRDHHPLHADVDYCRSRGFPSIIAHGLFGLSLMEGLKSELKLYENSSIASLGWTDVRFKKPIFDGDVLEVAFRFVEKRPSRQPGRGVVVEELSLLNQHGEAVIEARHSALILTRPVK